MTSNRNGSRRHGGLLRKFFAVAFSAIMAFSMVPAAAFAEEVATDADAATATDSVDAALADTVDAAVADAGTATAAAASDSAASDAADAAVSGTGDAAATCAVDAAAVETPQPNAAALAEGDIPITEEYFPDPIFRTWVWRNLAGGNSDWVITKSQRENVTSIILAPNDGSGYNTTGVKSLKGIEYFPNLMTMSFRDNKNLTSVDLSKNPKITAVDGRSSGITSLDLSQNPLVETVDVNYSKITSIMLPTGNTLKSLTASTTGLASIGNLSGAHGLEKLVAHHCKITELDTSGCDSLQWLEVNNNLLGSLDVSRNQNLTYLDCSNQIGANFNHLELGPALQRVYCSGSQLAELDVTGCPELTILACRTNPNLASIDVTKNPKLVELNCYGDAITSLDVSKNPLLAELTCYDNKLGTLDVSANPELATLNAKNCELTSLVVGEKNKVQRYTLTGNKLTHLDLTKCKYAGTVDTSNNVTEISVVGGTFDMSTLGLDVSRLVSATGATLDTSTGILTGMVGGTDAKYAYDAGAGQTLTFTLRPNVSIVVGGGDVNVVDANGKEVKSPLGESLTISDTGEQLAVSGGTVSGSSIVLPNDSRGQSAIAATVDAKDTDSDGKPDQVTVKTYYPTPVVANVSEDPLPDLAGNPMYVTEPLGPAVSLVDENGETCGRYYSTYTSLWIDRDGDYNTPVCAQVQRVEKDPATGLVNKVVVSRWYPTPAVNANGVPLYDKNAERIIIRKPVSKDVVLEGDNVSFAGEWGRNLKIVAADKGLYPAITVYLDTFDNDGDGQIDLIKSRVVYPIPIVSEAGDALYTDLMFHEQLYIAKANMLDPDVVLVGCTLEGSYDSGKLIVPNDRFGNAPSMVTVVQNSGGYNEDGGSRRLEVSAMYPVQLVGEDGVALKTPEGVNATIPALETADEETIVNGGTYDRDSDTVVVPSDRFGNSPLQASVELVKDGDQDGRWNQVTVGDVVYPAMVILADGDPYEDADGYLAIKGLVSPDVVVTGNEDHGGAAYSPDDNTVLVPDDENGNEPMKVTASWEDTDGDGYIDKIEITAVYPLGTLTFVDGNGNAISEDKITVTDGQGGPESLTAISPDLVVEGAEISGDLYQGGKIVVPNDEKGNPPISISVAVQDTDNDGYLDKMTVTPVYGEVIPVPDPDNPDPKDPDNPDPDNPVTPDTPEAGGDHKSGGDSASTSGKGGAKSGSGKLAKTADSAAIAGTVESATTGALIVFAVSGIVLVATGTALRRRKI